MMQTLRLLRRSCCVAFGTRTRSHAHVHRPSKNLRFFSSANFKTAPPGSSESLRQRSHYCRRRLLLLPFVVSVNIPPGGLVVRSDGCCVLLYARARTDGQWRRRTAAPPVRTEQQQRHDDDDVTSTDANETGRYCC